MKTLKLSKTGLFILSAGIFIVIVAGLGLTHSKQLQEQNRLDEELSVAETRLNNLQLKLLRQQQEELQWRLDEGTIQLMAAKDALRQTIESINVTDEFFKIAQSCGVVVMSFSSSRIESEEKLEDLSCSMIKVDGVAEGEVSNLINFIIRLNNDFTTGIVKSAQISIPCPAKGEPSVNIMMVVYTHEGD